MALRLLPSAGDCPDLAYASVSAIVSVSAPSPASTPASAQSAPVHLLAFFLLITAGWADVFATAATCARAVRQALGGLLCLGRRTLTGIIYTNGGERAPFAADYHLHSRAKWSAQGLFDTIWKHALPLLKGNVIGVAMDDTKLHKTGRCIKQAFYQRDPMGPAFHTNLILGLRFLQGSLLVPDTTEDASQRMATRALPIHFEEVSRVKRPNKKATPEEVAAWKVASKKQNLSTAAVQTMRSIRAALDKAGAALKTLILAVDGGFCNKACFGTVIERTELLARARKDARLCFQAEPTTKGPKSFYSKTKFTPESVRQDETRAYESSEVFYGGKPRPVRFKEVSKVYWQGGAKRRELRLIVVAPTPYQKRKSGKMYYRQAAYLLTTDLTTSVAELLQIYFDRWQIEVNHREEKDTLGVGQAQLWNERSVPKQPVLAVAAYSALMLAGLLAFGPKRTDAYEPLPIWRSTRQRRPSCRDLVNLLRKEATGTAAHLLPPGVLVSQEHLVKAAAA
jgi:DDE superfamily endonuclease